MGCTSMCFGYLTACIVLGTNDRIFPRSSRLYSFRVNEKPKSPSTFRCTSANASCCACAFRMVSPMSKKSVVINVIQP